MSQLMTFIAIVHIIVAVLLVGFVLLQDGKGGGIGGSFGGGSQTLFGATGGTNVLVTITRILAATFMICCVSLAVLSSKQKGRSVIDTMTPAPAVPGTPSTNTAEPATAPVQNSPTTTNGGSTTGH